MTNKPNILLIYTGGTIGMIKDYKTNALRAFDFSQIVEKIPELQQLNCKITSISFDEPIDSSNMNTKFYKDIAEIIESNYKKFDGFVVLTGSDTMSYTSSAISFMLENLTKPIIFSGSQLPIGDLRTDAKENLITSIEVAEPDASRGNMIVLICPPACLFVGDWFEEHLSSQFDVVRFETPQPGFFDRPHVITFLNVCPPPYPPFYFAVQLEQSTAHGYMYSIAPIRTRPLTPMIPYGLPVSDASGSMQITWDVSRVRLL